jgi:hypothetical protein
MGVTEFSFLFCLKVFFILAFFSLNILLLYTESLNNKYTKNTDPHLKSGMIPEIKKIASEVAIVIGIFSGLVTLKTEYRNHEARAREYARAQSLLEKSEEATRRATTERTTNNFFHKLHVASINNSYADIVKSEKHESELKRLIRERNID